MSAFTGDLVIKELVPGKKWQLVSPIRYEAGAKGSGCWIEVPAGFETDGATIPALIRLVLAVWGTYGRAACIHDYLYSLILRKGEFWYHDAFEGFRQNIGVNFMPFSFYFQELGEKKRTLRKARAWADREFRLAMFACGTSPSLAWSMWAAVRLCGWYYLWKDGKRAR